MKIRNETKWLCENARDLERYSGQWVMFTTMQGVVRKNDSLTRLLKESKNEPMREKPFVFHVPSKQELAAPLIGARRR
jgi:hypothetical protein